MTQSGAAVKKAHERNLVPDRKPLAPPRRPSPYAAACPTRLALDRIADKWTVLILGRLAAQPMRFNRLRREIEGLTQKTLAADLRSLERDGLVTRTVAPTVPVSVEYAITPLGVTLSAAVEGLRLWAETHIDAVLDAQKRYDARAT
ncbi:MAG: helix-turn-helix domain-containing protein [Roseiarcus sp.]|jgi:DNA-binding HxlR family transcriptional regulator